MKHTAVDFLINIIDQKDWINYTTEERLKVFEQAKEIEKQQQGYSEEDMKQFAFQCVANFLSNNDNKVEMSLVEVITDRNNKKFEQFKNK
jgi:hypothetical protein